MSEPDPKPVENEIKAPEPKKPLDLNYKPPVWSGPPPQGAKIEILKEGTIIKTIKLKDKHFFVFGRQEGSVDMVCEHQSISRMHLILQFKDTGDAYVYDLGSTHGTFINKRAIPSREYIKLNNYDLFKLGESTRLNIYSFDEKNTDPKDSQPNEALSKINESRKEKMLKLYEEKRKHDEDIQKSLSGEGPGWGMNFDIDDATRVDQAKRASLISEEDIARFGLQIGQQIDYSALKNKPDLSDPQKVAIKKAETTHKRIEKLMKELEGIQSKQAKMLDLTEGQQERMYKIESELEELRDTLENQEDNVRNMICNGCEEDNFDEVKQQRNFFKEWEEQDYNDEFYDRSKHNKFNKSQNKPKVTKADIKENDTYDSVKARLNSKMKEKDALMQKLIEINHFCKQKRNTEDFDELDAFMEQNTKLLKNDEKEYVSQRLKEANEEIEKLNSMLTFLMPSSFTTAQKLETKANPPEIESPSNHNESQAKKSSQKHGGGGLSEVFQKLSSMSKIKEQELKKHKEEQVQNEMENIISETPHFYQSESNDPITVADINAAEDQQMEEENEEHHESHNYFKEIVKNIKPVGEDDSIDTSNYSKFVKEFNDFHTRKQYEGGDVVKRQKTDDNSEHTVLKFGNQ